MRPSLRAVSVHPGLLWLLRLRWFAAVAQALTIGVTALWLPVPLHLSVLLGCLGLTSATNLAAFLAAERLNRDAVEWCAVLLALDTVTLSVLLGASGGVANPFTSFYFLHVTLAALLLPLRYMLGIIALVTGGFMVVNLVAPALALPAGLEPIGRFTALGLTIVCIAYFVGRTQDALRDAQLRLDRQERFAGLATLAAGVAHELATPLGTIAVVSRELERTACTQCLNHACRDDARLIRAETDRCRIIIDRLNADSTAGIGDVPERIDLVTLAEQLTPFLAAAHSARLLVQPIPAGRYPIATPPFAAPRAALFQSLAVLVKNACEADVRGGAVMLRVELDDGEVAFVVEDSGPGLAPASLDRVGEPFFTTKPPGEGMGLGLYIARMFAERLHGRLDLRPRPHGGTAARLVLPRPALHP